MREVIYNFKPRQLRPIGCDYKRFAYFKETIDNPLPWLRNLNEGLVSTYPLEKTGFYILKNFKQEAIDSNIRVYEDDLENGLLGIIVDILDKGENLKYLDAALRFCGYYLTQRTRSKDDNNRVISYYEPKIQNDISNEIRSSENYLFHVTPSHHWKKINKIGLVPRSTNNWYKYPERIYLLKGTLTTSNILTNLSKQLYAASNDKTKALSGGKYVVIRIALNKLPKHIPFFYDTQLDKCIYTTVNIPPKSFDKIEIINLKGG